MGTCTSRKEKKTYLYQPEATESIIDRGDRARLENTEPPQRVSQENMLNLPHRHIGAITYKGRQNRIGRGTGVLISPNLVLTSASNIWNRIDREPYKNIKFFLGVHGTMINQNSIVEQVFVDDDYKQNPSAENDFGLLKLKYKVQERDFMILGNVSGIRARIGLFGYPEQYYEEVSPIGPLQACYQWGKDNNNKIQEIDEATEVILHSIYSLKGQVGSPIIEYSSSGPKIVGIQTNGRTEANEKSVCIARMITSRCIGKLYIHSVSIEAEMFQSQTKFEQTMGSIFAIEYSNMLNEQGENQFKDKNISQAISSFKRSTVLNPQNIKAFNNLGLAYLQNNQYPEAIACLQKVVQSNKKDAKAYYNLARAQHKNKQVENAIKSYEESIKYEQTHLAFYNLGCAYQQTNKIKPAISCYQKANELDSGDAHCYYNLGLALRKEGKLDQSIECYQKALSIDSQFTIAYNNLGYTLNQHNKVLEAQECFHPYIGDDTENLAGSRLKLLKTKSKFSSNQDEEKIIRVNPGASSILSSNQGEIFRQKKQYKEAIEFYQRAIFFDSKNADAHFGLAQTLRDIKQLNEAIKEYSKALNLDHNLVAAYNRLGQTYLIVGQPQKAAQNFKKAAQLQPKNYIHYYNLGVSLSKSNNFNQAIEAFSAAIKLNQKCVQAYNQKGISLMEFFKQEKQKNPKHLTDAHQCFLKSIEINPQFAQAHNNIGLVLQLQEKSSEEVQAHFRNAIKVDSKYAPAYNNLGLLLQRQKKIQEAISSFEKAISINDKFSSAFYNLGILHSQNKQYRQSIECFKRVLDCQPGNQHNTKVHYNIALAYHSIDLYEDAIIHYNKVIEKQPQFFEAHNNIGLAYLKIKQTHQAIQQFEKAIKIDGQKASLHNNLGYAYQEASQFHTAINEYLKAINLDYRLENAYFNFVKAHQLTNQMDKCVQNYKKAIKKDNKNKETRLPQNVKNLATTILVPESNQKDGNKNPVNKKQGEKVKNQPKQKKSEGIYDEKGSMGYYYLGLALQDAEEIDKATFCYKEALRLNPNNFDILYNRALLLQKSNKLEEALRLYDRIIEISQKKLNQNSQQHSEDTIKSIKNRLSSAYNNKGLALKTKQHSNEIFQKEQKGQLNPAVQQFMKAIENNPFNQIAYFNYISTLLQQNEVQFQKRIDDTISSHFQALDYSKQDPLFIRDLIQELVNEAIIQVVKDKKMDLQLYKEDQLTFFIRHIIFQIKQNEKNIIKKNKKQFKEMYQKENDKIKDSIKYKLTQIAYNYFKKVQELTDKYFKSLKQEENSRQHARAIASNKLGIAIKKKSWLLAEKAFKEASEINPKDAEIIFNLGVLYHQKQNLEEAIQKYKTVILLNPQHSEVFYRLAIAVNETQKMLLFNEFNEKQNGQPKDQPNNQPNKAKDQADAKNYWKLGKALEQINHINKAIIYYEKAIKLSKDDWSLHYSLGKAYHEIKQDGLASEQLKKAIQINEKTLNSHENGIIHYHLGLVYKSQYQHEEAIKCFKKAIEIDSKLDPAYNEFIQALNLIPSETKKEQIISSTTSNYILYNRLGLALMQSNKIDEALKRFTQAVELRPNFSQGHNNLGQAYQQRGERQKAIQQFKKALDLNSNYIEAYNNLGLAYYEIKNYKKAVEIFNKALSLTKNNSKLYINLGAATQRLNEEEEEIEKAGGKKGVQLAALYS